MDNPKTALHVDDHTNEFTISYTPSQWFKFEPKEDIMIYELVLILNRMQISITSEIFDELPESAKRHFVEVK